MELHILEIRDIHKYVNTYFRSNNVLYYHLSDDFLNRNDYLYDFDIEQRAVCIESILITDRMKRNKMRCDEKLILLLLPLDTSLPVFQFYHADNCDGLV